MIFIVYLLAAVHTTATLSHLQLTTILADGSKKVGVQAFGESKARFNPSQKPSEGLQGRVDHAAASPASSGFR